MTKEQFLKKWVVGDKMPPDLEAVIANEIAKVKEVKPEEQNGNCSTFDMSRLVDQVQPAKQPAKPFDKDRFERMFRAVVASGRTERWEQDFKFTEEALAKLDAYYAEKEGGNNE